MKTRGKGEASGELSRLEKLALERISGKEAVSLMALVDDLSRELGYTTDRVTEGLRVLQSRKVIVISERTAHVSLTSYAFSPMSSWFWGGVIATLLSVVFAFATSGLTLYLRYAFGSLLILFLPGYSLIELLYAKKQLDELTVFALSIGLSLALVPLVGLVLNFTPFGIRLLPVAVSLAALTIALLTLALMSKFSYYRTSRGPAN